jgi:hypothetical protein
VFGWARDTVKIGAEVCRAQFPCASQDSLQAVIIGDEHRSIEFLRRQSKKTPYSTVKEHITARILNLDAKCKKMLSDSQTSRTELVVSLAPFLPCDLVLISDDTITRGSHTGLIGLSNLYGNTGTPHCRRFSQLSHRARSKFGSGHIRDCRRSGLERSSRRVSLPYRFEAKR